MKLLVTLLAAVMLLLSSCNNKPAPVEEKPVETPAAPVETKAAFTPFKAMMVMHTVKDFDKWYAGFSSPKHDSIQKSYGLTDPGVGRLLDNDKMVVVFFTAADIARAKEMAGSAALKEAMKKDGVTGAPAIGYWDVIMDDTSHIPQTERLMITHKVKDFDTWKKAYDAEGDATRAANGMVQRAMARGADDANLVTILFAITDMEKVKARVASPDMKKIMTDAGVEGAPQLTYFKWVN